MALLTEAGYVDSDADACATMTGNHPLTLLQAAGARNLALEARAFVLEARQGRHPDRRGRRGRPTILARLRRGEFESGAHGLGGTD